MPRVVHWGGDIGAADDETLVTLADASVPAVSPSSIDGPLLPGLIPLLSAGWSGQQGLAGSRAGRTSQPELDLVEVQRTAGGVRFELVDTPSGLRVGASVELDRHGVVSLRADVTNTGDDDWTVGGLALALPLPRRATELLDFAGRWSFERRPQRRRIDDGTWSRRSRHGRPGHDAPFLTVAGTPAFEFRSGEVWAAHLAWSGDSEIAVEAQSTGHVTISAGELLQPSEVVLAPGERYETPALLAAYAANGLDGLSERFHAHVRERRPLTARPLVLNTWEAVYFDHDLDRLLRLAELGAAVGVERFVLDDGWMTGRTDDTKALGDWTVDPERWPRGLHPLIDRVTALGMEFGLWVEPEMVSLDSTLARRHPDWVLTGDGGRLPQPWRHQYALDLGNPDAWQNVFDQLCALLDEYPIRYLKWDQNRDLLGGSAHRQTIATWRMMDALRERYPGLEIESCSSGGARVDLGVLERTDRFWPSDTNDPLERQSIQRWTGLLVPPELLGSHLGAATAHTTGRTSDLGLRLATALFLSAGIEWNLLETSPAELEQIAEWSALYRRLRPLLHGGTTVRQTSADATTLTHGVISPDRRHAVVARVTLAAPHDAVPEPLTVPGLDPERIYSVEPLPLGRSRVIQDSPPPWLPGPVRLSGAMLAQVGLAMPAMAPAQALLFSIDAI